MAEDRIEYAKLPIVGDLEEQARIKVTKLLEDLDEITLAKAKLAVQEDHLKDELERLQNETGKTGFRLGLLIFCAQQVKGRKTIDKMLLLENGCPASVLNASYKVGEPYVRSIFKRLDDEDAY